MSSIPITVLYDGRSYPLELHPAEPIALLRCQVWSCTGVEVAEQHITGLGAGVLRHQEDDDERPIASLSIAPGTWAMLDRRPARAEPKQPAVGAHPSVAAASAVQGRMQMEARLASGFHTARGHRDAAELAAAREAVPWERLRAEAKALRAEALSALKSKAADAALAAAALRDAVAVLSQMPRLPADARVTQVRFVPTETRAADCPQLQLARFRLYDRDGADIEISEVVNPGGSSPAGEGADRAIDGIAETKWLDCVKGSLVCTLVGRSSCVCVREPADVGDVGDHGAAEGSGVDGVDDGIPSESTSGGGVCIGSYAITTANDCPERDPVRWRLEGRCGVDAPWGLLDERSDARQAVPVQRHADWRVVCDASRLADAAAAAVQFGTANADAADSRAAAAAAASEAAAAAVAREEAAVAAVGASVGCDATGAGGGAVAAGMSGGEAPGEWELRALLRWFKSDFFRWVDRPCCALTGEPTELVGMGQPTEEERAGGASRVEVYKGPSGHLTRFPRYNQGSVLLRSRCVLPPPPVAGRAVPLPRVHLAPRLRIACDSHPLSALLCMHTGPRDARAPRQ